MCSSRWSDQVQNVMILFVSSIGKALLYMRPLTFFYCFDGCDTISGFNGKGNCSFFDAWMKSERKDELTKTFVRLRHILESTESVDIFNIESLVKDAYFGTSHDKTKSVSSFRKDQFV